MNEKRVVWVKVSLSLLVGVGASAGAGVGQASAREESREASEEQWALETLSGLDLEKIPAFREGSPCMRSTRS